MSKNLTKCPVCGSANITRHEQDNCHQLTLGNKFHYKEIFYKCTLCNEEGDFFSDTDVNYIKAQKEAQILFVKDAIEELNKSYSMAMLERVFELPARTLTRWKNGDFSSSGLALLRILVTYPWITDVAEHRFNSIVKNFALINAGIKELENISQKSLSKFTTDFSEKISGGSINKPQRVEITNPPAASSGYEPSFAIGM